MLFSKEVEWAKIYNEAFFSGQAGGSRCSALEIVPIIISLLGCKSVIDVGCGLGTWLSVFIQYGVKDVLGLDGSHVNCKQLGISQEFFLPTDLRKPININRRFELVMSLEVAEHLPLTCAEDFIEFLIRLGPVILFSAAIPLQGGLHVGHVNEQWPDFWVKIFEKHGYKVVDCLRYRIWDNPKVEWWYAQNMLVFIKADLIGEYPFLEKESLKCHGPLSLVHPKLYLINSGLQETTD